MGQRFKLRPSGCGDLLESADDAVRLTIGQIGALREHVRHSSGLAANLIGHRRWEPGA